jgi:hypothetical protein
VRTTRQSTQADRPLIHSWALVLRLASPKEPTVTISYLSSEQWLTTNQEHKFRDKAQLGRASGMGEFLSSTFPHSPLHFVASVSSYPEQEDGYWHSYRGLRRLPVRNRPYLAQLHSYPIRRRSVRLADDQLLQSLPIPHCIDRLAEDHLLQSITRAATWSWYSK